jgi:type II secretory pathway pseudopilin PulG
MKAKLLRSTKLLIALAIIVTVTAIVLALLAVRTRQQASDLEARAATLQTQTKTSADPTPDQSPKPKAGVLLNADGSSPKRLPPNAGNGDACNGNPADTCVMAPTVDFWPSGSEDSSNHDYAAPAGSVIKEIGGKLVSSTDNTLTLSTTSGRTFRITYPLDSIAWWNDKRSPHYQNYKVGTGDTFMVMYGEPPATSSTDIGPKQIHSSRFKLAP